MKQVAISIPTLYESEKTDGRKIARSEGTSCTKLEKSVNWHDKSCYMAREKLSKTVLFFGNMTTLGWERRKEGKMCNESEERRSVCVNLRSFLCVCGTTGISFR